MEQPLSIRNYRPASLAFLRFEPVAGIAKDRWDDYFLVGANDLRFAGSAREDYDVWRMAWRRRQPLGPSSDWWFEVPVVSRGGGFLDGPIDWFHNNFLANRNPFRDNWPKNRHEYRVPGSSFGPATGLGDVTVGLGQQLGKNASARVALKFPTGDASKLLGSGGLDAGISVQHRWKLLPGLDVHVGGSLVAQSRSAHLDSTRGLVESASVALVYAKNRRDTYLLQWNSEASPTVTGIPTLDATHRVFSFGYRRWLGEGMALTLSVSEDRDFGPTNFNGGAQIGPDLTFGVQISVVPK